MWHFLNQRPVFYTNFYSTKYFAINIIFVDGAYKNGKIQFC